MTDGKIRIIALDCGFKLKPQNSSLEDLNEYVYTFARSIAEIEREECAQIADRWTTDEQRKLGNGGPAAAIRAKGKK